MRSRGRAGLFGRILDGGTILLRRALPLHSTPAAHGRWPSPALHRTAIGESFAELCETAEVGPQPAAVQALRPEPQAG